MQNKYAFPSFTFAILSMLLLTTNLSINNADAQQVTLSVSAKDTGGEFFGPQIVQVIVEGPNIRNADTSTASLVVNGQDVPLVHLADSRWYAFFADANTFTTLAGAAGFPGSSNGAFWVVGPSNRNLLFPSLSSAFANDVVTNNSLNPNLDLNGDCPATVNDQNPCVEWPYIRLMSFTENDQVSIRHSGQSVTLNYVRPSTNDIILSLDRTTYPIDAEIIFGLSDYMWNINPVEEDRVHFAFSNGNTQVFYQPSTALPPASISGVLQNLRFVTKQILSIEGEGAIRFANTISGMPETVMIETFPNSGMFENFDSRADMFAQERNAQFRFDYFDKSISAGAQRSDASVSVSKNPPKTGSNIPEVKEEHVKIEPYAISELKLVNLLDRPISSVSVEQPVLIQTTVSNNLDEEQPFVYIVQVKDENEFTVMLTWIKGNMFAKNSFSTSISWTPESEGDYNIEVFVWKSIDEPGMSPLTKSLEVSVS